MRVYLNKPLINDDLLGIAQSDLVLASSDAIGSQNGRPANVPFLPANGSHVSFLVFMPQVTKTCTHSDSAIRYCPPFSLQNEVDCKTFGCTISSRHVGTNSHDEH
jgi:hypothetical protein